MACRGSNSGRRHTRLREEISERRITTLRPDVFRIVTPARVLENFGAVFEGSQSATFKLSEDGPDAVRSDDSAVPLRESQLSDADAVFYATQVATSVDAFLSHAWGAPRWQKALAVYYYLNVNFAIVVSVGAWLCAAAWLIGSNGFTGMGGWDLVPFLVYAPVCLFFVCLFCGHHVRASVSSLWLDKLCIHQLNPELRLLGVSSLPEVVGAAERLCVLWSDTYFERLWCNAEVATFCALRGGAEQVDFVPLWLPPWVLLAILLDLVCSSLCARMSFVAPVIGEMLMDRLGAELWVLCLVAVCACVLQHTVGYLPLVLPNYFALTTKLREHQGMLGQLRDFRHASAKCTVESDRPKVVEHICGLFGEDGDDSEQAVRRFDEFMGSELATSIRAQVGAANVLPLREAFLVVMPLVYTAVAIVLACDGQACADSARLEMPPPPPWLGAVPAYMLVNGGSYALACLATYPATYPSMLLLVARAQTLGWPRLRAAATVGAIILCYCLMGVGIGVSCGFVLFAVECGGWFIAAAGLWALLLVAYLLWVTGFKLRMRSA
ncbi:unnamed protein product [Prorocentrum cordatum]|uniref:Transmembrane protein n=1 Tax=Prorocentrum cordatum TaxID=2364126 RepID=A0ABN9PNG1_9DINO|nr:unnamed protein product [Polarella glacialis]